FRNGGSIRFHITTPSRLRYGQLIRDQ
ncbi:unnamed protein product, partial [Rotaria sp. Silwood2]